MYLKCIISHRGAYCDGKLKAPVKPCAGNVGTQILVCLTQITFIVKYLRYSTLSSSCLGRRFVLQCNNQKKSTEKCI